MLIFAFSGALLAFGAPAGSQGSEPYVSPFGDLTIEADSLLPGSTVMLSGDGFTPDTDAALTRFRREDARGTWTLEVETCWVTSQGSQEFLPCVIPFRLRSANNAPTSAPPLRERGCPSTSQY